MVKSTTRPKIQKREVLNRTKRMLVYSRRAEIRRQSIGSLTLC